MERINDFIIADRHELTPLFEELGHTSDILDLSLIKEDSMGNTAYAVTTPSRRYFLKLYSNATDSTEAAALKYLKGKINVPELYFYDGSKRRFPYAYAIMEYIDGEPFTKYLNAVQNYPPESAYEIGRMCAIMHSRKYEHDALLNENLDISQKLPDTRDKILYLTHARPAEYLKNETLETLRAFIGKNSVLFDQIESESVLCHGDFRHGNIMISRGKIYFIDFEFAYSGSIYHDIGHLFRKNSDMLQTFTGQHVCDSFVHGYNSISLTPLPENWLALARLCDISSLLCLLTRENISDKWVKNIENTILLTIRKYAPE